MAALVTEKKLINLPLSANMYTAGDINRLLENKVDKQNGKNLSTNDYTNADKNKLNNIQAGAEVNQNAFSRIKVGSTTIDSGSKTDTLELSAGNNVVLTTDPTARKIVIHSLGGGGGGAVQADWSQTDPVQLDYIKNKPTTFPPESHRHDVADINNVATVAKTGSYNDLVHTPVIPPAQVNADWNATSGVAMILNKPSVVGEQVNSDWNAISGVAQILNKPTIPAAQIQSNWNQTNSSAVDFIKNKPTIPAAQVNSDWNATSGVAQIINKPLTFPPSSHTHEQSEITGLDLALAGKSSTNHTHAQLNNDQSTFMIYENGTIVQQNSVTSSKNGKTEYPVIWVGPWCQLTNISSGFSFRTSGASEAPWDNNLIFYKWGKIGYIYGEFKCNRNLAAGETFNYVAKITIPSGIEIFGGASGVTTHAVTSIGTDTSIILAITSAIPANHSVGIRVVLPINYII